MANPNTRLVLDLARDTDTIIDMTPYFQGRVGDSQASVPLALRYYGKPFSLEGYDVIFEGQDPAGNKKRVYGTANTSMPADSWQLGRCTFNFPSGVFTTPGKWESAFFRVVKSGEDPDKSGTKISTLPLALNVFDDQVEVKTDIVEAYDSGMQTMLDEYYEIVQTKIKDLNNLPTELRIAQDTATEIQALVQQYLDLFDAKGVPTAAQLNAAASSAQQNAQNYTDTQIKTIQLKIDGLTGTSSNFDTAILPNHDYVMSASSYNGPNKTAGVCSVHGTASHQYQRFVDDNNVMWHRIYRNGSWTSWLQDTSFN